MVTIKDRLLLLNNMIDDRRRRLSELERQLKVLRSELDTLIAMKDELNPCHGCQGKGEVINFKDQDEAHFEICDECRGSGVRPLTGR
ncbi:MAG: hypothetical protein UT43_C0033G0003 [Parcubacteria group bacterium GW2011_GWC1_39_29]|nr:MAG: hypothetical protein UT43_C0033G0003 [Parcubacteria group bacterium GW2011_GWC1_39_29]